MLLHDSLNASSILCHPHLKWGKVMLVCVPLLQRSNCLSVAHVMVARDGPDGCKHEWPGRRRDVMLT